MNRKDLIESLASTADVTPEQARRCLDALFGTRQAVGVLGRALESGDTVRLVGFGTFEARFRPARRGHNPRTGEPIQIAARTSAIYRPAAALQQRLQARQAAGSSDAAAVEPGDRRELGVPRRVEGRDRRRQSP